jgi:hypothetical protein
MHFAALVKFNLQFLFCFILQILLHVLILLILNAAYLANSYLILILRSVLLQITFFLHIAFFIFNRYSSMRARNNTIIAKTLPQGKAKIQDISFFLEFAQGPSTYFKSTLFSRFRKIVFNKKNWLSTVLDSISFAKFFKAK